MAKTPANRKKAPDLRRKKPSLPPEKLKEILDKTFLNHGKDGRRDID